MTKSEYRAYRARVAAMRVAASSAEGVVVAAAHANWVNLHGAAAPDEYVPTLEQFLDYLPGPARAREQAELRLARVLRALSDAGDRRLLDFALLDADPAVFLERAQELHQAAAAVSDATLQYVADPLVAAWQGEDVAGAVWDSGKHTNLPGPLVRTRRIVVVAAQSDLPFGRLPVLKEPRFEVGYLPHLAPEPSKVLPMELLGLFDGLRINARGPAVPVAARLGWEVLVAVDHSMRGGGPNWLAVPLMYLYRMIFPGMRWDTRYAMRLLNGLRALDLARIRWRGDAKGGMYPLVEVYRLPSVLGREEVVTLMCHLPRGSQQGPQVDRLLLRELAARSARKHRLMLSAYCAWDRFATVNGRLIQPTLPVVRRDDQGYVLDALGRVQTERGRPSRRATHRAAVHVGGREANPEVSRYPIFAGNDLILVGYSSVGSTRAYRQKQRQRVVAAARELHDEGRFVLQEFRGATAPGGARPVVGIRLLPSREHLEGHAARWAARTAVERRAAAARGAG